MAVTDALEMQAVSATVGMEEGAVLALRRRSRRPLPRARHRRGPRRPRPDGDRRARCGRAGWARSGSPRPQRESRHRTRQRLSTETVGPSFAALGLDAARRALRSEGTVAVQGPVLVVELAGTLSVAAGPPVTRSRVDHARARRRRRHVPSRPGRVGRRGRRSSQATRDAAPSSSFVTSTATRGSRMRSPPFSRPATAESSSTSAIPAAGAPAGGAGRVTTFGAGRASLLAAAELLLGGAR